MKQEIGTEEAKAEFLTFASELLSPHNLKGRAMRAYLSRLSRQYRIQNSDARDVLNEAILRGVAYIDRHGQKIANPSAWIRSTSLNIIRNTIRREKKNRQLSEKVSVQSPGEEILDKLEINEERQSAREALALLSEQDREILLLRFVEEKSYKEIHSTLLEEKGESVKVAALRKRESRAVMRLRQAFMNLYNLADETARY